MQGMIVRSAAGEPLIASQGGEEAIAGVSQDRLEIGVQDDLEAVHVVWQGRCELGDPAALLDPLWERVTVRAIERAVPVQMDLSKLEHLSISTVGSLVQLCERLASHGVELVVVFDGARCTQAGAVAAMRAQVLPDGLLQTRMLQ